MSEKEITINPTITHVAAKVDGFTKTQEHFIVEADGFTAMAAYLSKAISDLKEIIAKANEVKTYWIEIGRQTHTDETLRAKYVETLHDEAIRNNTAVDYRAKEQADEAEFRVIRDLELTGINLNDVRVARNTYGAKPTVEVSGIRRWSNYRHKHETYIRDRKFPMNKKGEFNWAKIREAAKQVADYKARERTNAQAIETGKQKSEQLRKALGILSDSKMVRTHDNGTITFTLTAKTEAEGRVIVNMLQDADIAIV